MTVEEVLLAARGRVAEGAEPYDAITAVARYELGQGALERLRQAVGDVNTTVWARERSTAEILAAFDRAADLA